MAERSALAEQYEKDLGELNKFLQTPVNKDNVDIVNKNINDYFNKVVSYLYSTGKDHTIIPQIIFPSTQFAIAKMNEKFAEIMVKYESKEDKETVVLNGFFPQGHEKAGKSPITKEEVEELRQLYEEINNAKNEELKEIKEKRVTQLTEWQEKVKKIKASIKKPQPIVTE